MNEKERAVLYALSEVPTLLEKVTVRATLFTGQSRQIFNEIERQFQATQAFSYEEAADKLGMKTSELMGLYEGCYRFDDAKLAATVRQIKREALCKRLQATLKKEIDTQEKTATVDDAAMAKIRGMFHKLDALSEVEACTLDLTAVDEKSTAWLWPGRIPLGMISLIAGHPGVGKSFFTLFLAAQLSRGRALPDADGNAEPHSTLLISAEDDPSQVIRPRLEGNGADPKRIILFADPMKFSLDSLATLDRELEKNPDIRMVVIDPLNTFLGRGTDYFRDPDVRAKLLPLKELAQERMIAILGVVHFNKKEDSDIITRIGGSMAFAGVARSILGVSHDLRETGGDASDVRLVSSLKMNLMRKPATLAFKINDDLHISLDPTPVQVDAEALFSREGRERRQHQSIIERWLLDYLAQHTEPTSKEVRSAATEEGFAQTTLYRARANLEARGLVSSHEAGFGKDKITAWKLANRGGEEN